MSDTHLTEEEVPSPDGTSSEDTSMPDSEIDDNHLIAFEEVAALIEDLDKDEATDALASILAAARRSEADYLDRLQRVTAEFDNFRKRSLREQQQLRELGSERVLSSLLPTLDSFDAAMAVPAESESEQRLLAGMAGTHTQLMEVVGREGLAPIPAVGEEFDPNVHEAISSPANPSGPLVVIAEIRRGYKLKDRVIRPALVALGMKEDLDTETQDQG